MWSPTDGNLSDLCVGATSLLVPETFKFKFLKRDFQLPTIMGMWSNISLSGCPSWYPLNSCRYLKSETQLWNAPLNKASSVNKGIVKTCLVVDMVRNNWLQIVVASCGLHYFVSARFGSFGVFASFSPAERFKYLFFTAMKIHTMARIVKKQNNFIFSSLVT